MTTENIQKDQETRAARKNFAVAADSELSERLTYTVEQAGRALGISRAAAFKFANNGTLPVIRLGKRLLVPKVAIERMLASV
jgi:excisionase family DNA binding protein